MEPTRQGPRWATLPQSHRVGVMDSGLVDLFW